MASGRIKSNVVQLPFTTENLNDDTINPQSQGNGDGGGNDMRKNDYVTHEELNHATDNLSNEIKLLGKDVDKKFVEQKLWFIGTGLSIVVSTCGILGFLMNLFK